jgi:hypothetical protein
LAIWSLTGITLFDSIAFSLLAIIVLYLVGFGFLKLICKLSKSADPLGRLDVFQKLSFRVFLGFAFVFLFLLVFSLSGLPFIVMTWLIVAIAIAAPLCIYVWSVRHGSFKFALLGRFKAESWVLGILVLTVLLVTLYFSSSLIVGLFGTTNDDGAFHTSIVRVILDNPSSLVTRGMAPYASFINTYPSASHAMSAFFVSLLNVPIQEVVILFCAVLPALIALAVYSTVKCLFSSPVLAACGTVVAAFFSLSFSWGPISWSGLPILLSFFVSISAMGLISIVFEKGQKGWLEALLVGFCFFIAINTYPAALVLVFVWFGLVLVSKKAGAIRKLKSLSRGLLGRRNILVLAAFLVPILLSLPYLYTTSTHSTSFQQNYPSDVTYNQMVEGTQFVNNLTRTRISFDWVADLPALANFFSGFEPLFTLAALGLVVIAGLYVAKVFGYELFPRKFLVSACLIYSLFLLLMVFLAFVVYVPVGYFRFFDTERVWQHLFIPELFLTSIVLFVGGYVLFAFVRSSLKGNAGLTVAKRRLTQFLAAVLLFVVFFNLVVVSVPLVSASEDKYKSFKGYLGEFSSLGRDDVALMGWMTDNVPSDARVLVSAGDSGQFLTAVTQLHSVYSYDLRVFSQRYLDLMFFMTTNPYDVQAVKLMLSYNISYVYVGSVATNFSSDYSFRKQFNASDLLATPYFSVAHQLGNAWLLQFNTSLAVAVSERYDALDKAYYWDNRYPVSHVFNGNALCSYLDNANFSKLNSDELKDWLNRHLNDDSSTSSTLIMTMGVAPDTVVDLSGNSLLMQYLDAGGHVVWLADVPFFYQGHADRSKTEWGNAGPIKVLSVSFFYWEFNATPAVVSKAGYRWGMSLANFATSQRPVLPSDVTTVLSSTDGYASSWHKNYNSAFIDSGFVRYSYQDFNGSDVARVNDAINLAVYPFVSRFINLSVG